jgi:hypothetical protein
MKRFCAIVVVSSLLAVPVLRAERLPRLTETDVATWKICLKQTLMKPPCCNACSLFTLEDARALLGYLRGAEDSARGQKLWTRHRERLLTEFQKIDPPRFAELYGAPANKGDPIP